MQTLKVLVSVYMWMNEQCKWTFYTYKGLLYLYDFHAYHLIKFFGKDLF